MTDETAPAPAYTPRPFGSPQSDSLLAAVDGQPATAARGTAAAPRSPYRLPRRAGMAGIVLLAVACVAAYAASPLVTAWSVREAVRSGNSDYLRTAIDWPRIKDTLKTSMTRYALDVGGVETVATAGNGDLPGTRDDGDAKLSLWQRIKANYGRRVVDGMIESYVTPEGLPTLFKLRTGFNTTIGRKPIVPEDAGLVARIRGEWSRVRQARFETPTRFALELDDKFEAGRRIAGVLQFEVSTARIGWRLVSLELNRSPVESAKAETSQSLLASR